jgi:multimeric flavodoxin WrbA
MSTSSAAVGICLGAPLISWKIARTIALGCMLSFCCKPGTGGGGAGCGFKSVIVTRARDELNSCHSIILGSPVFR